VSREYSDYLVGKYALTRNEIDQIGYRLAKELGHRSIFSVDVDGDFPYLRVVNYAKANGLKWKFDALAAGKLRQDIANDATVRLRKLADLREARR
jgi:uncharacterized protein DUF5694